MKVIRVLIAYSSRFGHCQKIAEAICQVLQNEGAMCDVFNLETSQPPNAMMDYDVVVITASIRYGKFHKKLNEFIAQYRNELKDTLDVFIPVNLVARKPHKRLLENNNYVNQFLQAIDWQPSTINIMPGALEYPKYNFLDRSMIQFIMWMGKGETNPKKSVDYTDWNEVNRFAQEIYQSALAKQ